VKVEGRSRKFSILLEAREIDAGWSFGSGTCSQHIYTKAPMLGGLCRIKLLRA
jgi:hypothetical protein